MVVRRAWPEFARRGYGLGNISKHLAIEFKHHDAKEDARAAGEVLLKAIHVSGLSLEEWLVRVQKRISLSEGGSIARPGATEGALYGEVLTLTGALSLPRKEAAALAAQMGCEIEDGVTKHTTMIVVGDQDIRRLAGHERSTKHRKAEALILKGQSIRVLGESDFRRLVGGQLAGYMVLTARQPDDIGARAYVCIGARLMELAPSCQDVRMRRVSVDASERCSQPGS